MKTGTKRVLRVSGARFVAGAVWMKSGDDWRCERAAPIIKWMKGMFARAARERLLQAGFKWEWVRPEAFSQTMEGITMNAWETEPKEDEFESSGLTCVMRRDFNMVWNGYVGVPESHPLYRQRRDVMVQVPADAVGLKIDPTRIAISDTRGVPLKAALDNSAPVPLSILIDVHGGLWSTGILESHPDLWFFGFQCGHAGDYRPADPTNEQARQNAATAERPYTPADYRTYDYAHGETERLAAQLEALQTVEISNGTA